MQNPHRWLNEIPVLLGVLIASCLASAQVTQQWAHFVDDAVAHGTDIATDAVSDGTSYLYVVGTVATGTNQSSIVVTRYDLTCTQGDACSPPSMRWPATPNGRVNEGVAITVDPDFPNQIYVAGRAVNASGNSDFVLLKLTSSLTLDPAWSVNPRVYDNLGEDVAVDVSAHCGMVGIAGKSDGGATGWDYAAVVYQQGDGTPIGSPVRWPGSGTDTPVGVWAGGTCGLEALAQLIVGGTSTSFGTANDYWTVKYEFDGVSWVFSTTWADNGNGIGRRRYNNPTWGGNDTATSMWSDGGTVLVTGSSIHVAPDSGLGLLNVPESDIDYCTVGYDSSGYAEWPELQHPWGAGVHRYAGPANGIDVATQVTCAKLHGVYQNQIPDGNYIALTGRSVGVGTSYDIAMILFDAPTGANKWIYRLSTNANEQGNAVAIIPSAGWRVGYTYTTGRKLVSGTWDILTDGRQANGTEIPLQNPKWPRQFNGPGSGSDVPSVIVLNWQDVFVAGQALNNAPNGLDSVTIKYHQEP